MQHAACMFHASSPLPAVQHALYTIHHAGRVCGSGGRSKHSLRVEADFPLPDP
jgi:hypothetical protein